MFEEIGYVVFVVVAVAVLLGLAVAFSPTSERDELSTITKISVPISSTYTLVNFSNGGSYPTGSFDSSYTGYPVEVHYKKFNFVGEQITGFKVIVSKDSTIVDVIYKDDGFLPWEKNDVRVIFSDGSNLAFDGGTIYKFNVYSKLLAVDGKQVSLTYTIDDENKIEFRSVVYVT